MPNKKHNKYFLNKCNKIFISIMAVVLLMSGCTLPGLGASVSEDGIIIAGGNTTERQILAEIVSQMCNHYIADADTTLINNLGSTMLIVQALTREDANLSGAMYTGTSLTGELGMEPTTDSDEAMRGVVKGYDQKYDMVWFPSYGFENTYTFMITRQMSEEKGITKISDLEKYSEELGVGVDTAWIDRPGDGYEGFKKLYGFEFSKINPMEIGLVYDAVSAGEMDVVLGYSTDGRINAYDLVLLEDDLNLFPPYETSPVVTKRLLCRYPELEIVLLKLENSINSSTMQKINRISDEDHVEPRVIATRFLEENNYFEHKEVVPLGERELYKDILRDVLPLKLKGGKNND